MTIRRLYRLLTIAAFASIAGGAWADEPVVSPEALQRIHQETLHQLQQQQPQQQQQVPNLPNEQLLQLLNHPRVKRLTALAADQTFSQSLIKLVTHPDRTRLLYLDLAWIVVLLLLRWSLTSGEVHWLMRIWHRLWTWLASVGGATILIPLWILGPDYAEVMGKLIKALIGS